MTSVATKRPGPRGGTSTRGQDTPTAPRGNQLEPRQALALPLACCIGLAALSLLPSVRQHAVLARSFWGASAVLIIWTALLFFVKGSRRESFAVEIVLRKQHYLQACAQLSVMLYWGRYWSEVYQSAHLIAAQLLFAYAFDMLLSWSRRDTYTLGFAPFPVIFSINLFLWFKPDWFYLQFLMVAVGFAAKELIRWKKDGHWAHIFNPSSFPLGLFSLVLILTGTTGITWGQEIANTFERPPYIRWWIFLVGLPGQFLFGVTTMTMSAVLSVFGFGLAYFWIFGTYFFVDAFIPAAVFLGMHLLFTDPSTSPRTELGRILYGVLYGLGVIALFSFLQRMGAPTFYDKLMAVPLMNLAIQLIDRAARSNLLRRFDPALLFQALKGRQRNLAYMSVWAVAFVVVSDPTASYRPRRWVPFWQQACADGRRDGCQILAAIEAQYCDQGSAWACNDLGLLESAGRAATSISPRTAFERACSVGLLAACQNLAPAQSGANEQLGSANRRSQPLPGDYPILLQEGQGPLSDLAAPQLFDRACQQGWADGCNRLAGIYWNATGVPRDVDRTIAALDRACTLRLASACADLGVLLEEGEGIPHDPQKSLAYLTRACDGGFKAACERLKARPPAKSGN